MSSAVIKCSPFITLCLGSIENDCAISELCYKGTFLPRNYREMAISWAFPIIPL